LHAEAERQVDRALALRRQELGEQHPETLSTANELAFLLMPLGFHMRTVGYG
jgi:hypothetical protein